MSSRQLKYIIRFMNEKNDINKYVNEAKIFFKNCSAEKFTSSVVAHTVYKFEDDLNCDSNLYEIPITIECQNIKVDSDVDIFGSGIGKKWCEESKTNIYLHWLIPDPSNTSSLSYNVHYGNIKVTELAFGTMPNMKIFTEEHSFQSKGIYSEILFTFNHLQRHFIFFISNTHHETCHNFGEMRHKILIQYDSLLRIIGTLDPQQKFAEIFLHLDHPPFIYVTHGNLQPEIKNPGYDINKRRVNKAKQIEHDACKFERTFSFGCKCNHTLCESNMKIGRALVLKLVIHDKYQMKELIEQLILRCTKKTEVCLTSLRTMKLAQTLRWLIDFPWLNSTHEASISENDKFSCEYAWKSLMSRSLVIIHQTELKKLNDPKHVLSLQKKLVSFALKTPDALCKALFHLSEMIDGGIMFIFEAVLEEKYSFFCQFKELNALPKGMCFVRRVIITPSRVIFLRPYEHFDNRIIRQFGVEYMLRISIQDDNFSKLTYAVQYNSNKKNIMKDIVSSTLSKGFKIGARKYEVLASSASQLREHGLWMYAKDSKGWTASTIRKWMGDFRGIHNIAKYMARMGQCLSSTEEGVQVYIDSNSEFLLPDINTKCGDYIFSDGIGVLSSSLATEVRLGLTKNGNLEIDANVYEPTAFQIRYRGCKGMVVENPTVSGRAIGIRPSMKKFECVNSKQLEIVKVSAPRKLFLNKHLITILEQMGIPKETFLELQSDMMVHLLESLMNENRAAYVLLHNLSLDFAIKDLQTANFTFTNEPFFRSLLLAFFKSSATKLPTSMRIAIPEKYGRNMLGVLDETGTLKYGQVFVQYNESITHPKHCKILTGPVIVTKNPCLHPGDVRKLMAVDVPSLYHIKDCIVFPARGNRPHPDEMAGSDLDGDEFVVLWYKSLIFDCQNVKPMHYPSYEEKSPKKNFDVSDMVEFFCHYIQNDCIGTFAHAHLVWADRLENGIFSPKCMQIARNYPYVLDFAKHGTTKYLARSERPDQYPDFMQKGISGNSYHSKRALGSLYRVSRVLEASSSKIHLSAKATFADPNLIYPGWEKYEESAAIHEVRYRNMILEILARYNLSCEAEAFAGIVELDLCKKWRNEKLDTVKVMKAYVRNIMLKFRSKFMKEVQDEKESFGLSDDKVKQCKLQRASAWYMVVYGKKLKAVLSFPWILSDILAEIKTVRSKATCCENNFLRDIDADIQSCISSDLLNQRVCHCRELTERVLLQWMSHSRLNILSSQVDSTCSRCYQRVLSSFWSHSGFHCCSGSSLRECICSENCSATRLILELFKFFFRRADASIGQCGNGCDGFIPRNLQELSLQTLCHLAITRNIYYLGLDFNTDNFTKDSLPVNLIRGIFEEEGEPIKISVGSTLKKLIEESMDDVKAHLMKQSGVSHLILLPDRDLYGNLCLIVNSFGKNWQRWNLQEIVLDPDFTSKIQDALK